MTHRDSPGRRCAVQTLGGTSGSWGLGIRGGKEAAGRAICFANRGFHLPQNPGTKSQHVPVFEQNSMAFTSVTWKKACNFAE